MDAVNIYTDGACSGNQFENNAGGWGAILEYKGKAKELFGGERDTTNNRMELTALIAALEALTKDGFQVRVFSDSSYLTNCLRNRWHERWAKNGWKTQAKKSVENRDLWERLIAFLPHFDFRFYLVKGHIPKGASEQALKKHFEKFKQNNGESFSYEEFLHIVERNNLADALANKGADKSRSEG